jgi:hypothetical protein
MGRMAASPLSLIPRLVFAAARSGQGREAAQRTLDGEDRCGTSLGRERGRSLSERGSVVGSDAEC